tara:strand:+ start:197 stop:442 length:246 start_codon:yes stop_codon:yes gene_type:complete
MKMKIDIEFDTKWIRRDPKWLATFLTGYLSSLAGYKVTNVDLIDDSGKKVEKISVSCEDCGELFDHNPHKCIHIGDTLVEE